MRDEVRVMTVHGAKGLEAPIVFLPDTCATGTANSGGKIVALEDLRPNADAAAPFVWPVSGSKSLQPIVDARELQKQRDVEESNRLLYVAMTRPRDRLIVAGFEGKRGRGKGCWFDLVCAGLGVDPDAPGDDPVLWRLDEAQADGVAPDAKPKDAAEDVSPVARPAWALTAAPREKSLSIPLAPSRLAPYETDDAGEPSPDEPARDPLAEPAASPPVVAKGDGAGLAGDRFLRGTLTHALLEHLPGIAAKARTKAAAAYLEARAGHLPERARTSIAKEALAILADPTFGALFSAASRAEVPLVAEIPNPSGRGPALKLTGQIDRLAVTDDAVLIIDYKTNRAAPASVEDVAPVYLYQLAAYRLALAEIYPDKPVRAALLWTEVPHLMEIPPAILDRYAAGLWSLDAASLDAAGGRS
jgi:ATP-dependent helicase/nuclease subunit A